MKMNEEKLKRNWRETEDKKENEKGGPKDLDVWEAALLLSESSPAAQAAKMGEDAVTVDSRQHTCDDEGLQPLNNDIIIIIFITMASS